MKGWRVVAGVAAVSIACAGAAAMTDEDRALMKGQSAAYELSETVRGKLVDSMKASGPGGAIRVCGYQALALADEVSDRRGVKVRRTTLRLRNPKNAPDAYERALLERLQEQSLTGKVPQEVFEASEADGKKVYRYAKPLTVGPVCLACHGSPAEVSEEVRELLKESYPGDLAMGYKTGDLRGIVSVVIPVE